MKRSTAKLFLKCTRWQVEETTDLVNCPFHYFCDSARQEDFAPAVDLLFLLFVVSSLLSVAAFTLLDLARRRGRRRFGVGRLRRRHLLPSGPLALSLVVLIFANGRRIDAVARLGPALLQLVYISAMAFRNRVAGDVRYSVLEASTVSGILHASLRLDGVLLPYYTGMAAMRDSVFSGVCATCVCRSRELVVAGNVAGYRGWSMATVLVAGTLCARMSCRVFGGGGGSAASRGISAAVEMLAWGWIAADCVGLWAAEPEAVTTKRGLLDAGVHGGVCSLVLINLVRVAFDVAIAVVAASKKGKKGNGKEKVLLFARDVEMAL